MTSKLISDLLLQKGIYDIDTIELTKKCDDFNLGCYTGAVVKFTNGRSDLHLFLKMCKKGSFTYTAHSELLTYAKESAFYEKILPSFVQFERERKLKDILPVPINTMCFQYFGTGMVDEDKYIVMEKFSDDDYYVKVRGDFHAGQEPICAMKYIGAFHAVSFCMKTLKNVDFLQTYPILEEKLFQPTCPKTISLFFTGSYKTNLKLIKAVLTEVKKGNPLVYKFISYSERLKDVLEKLDFTSDHIWAIFRKLCTSVDKCSVVCHGDFHMGNIAFNRHVSNGLKMFDFQAIRFASGLLDVHQYLSQVTSPKTREDHLEEFLVEYCNTFKQTCECLGLVNDSSNIFTLEFIKKEYARTAPWGFLFGFMFINRRFIPNDKWVKLEETEDSYEIMAILDDLSLWHIVEIYLDLIQEAYHNGTINNMESLIHG